MLLALVLRSFLPLAVVFAVGGLGWALVNVNSLPMVVDMTTLACIISSPRPPTSSPRRRPGS